MTSRERVRAALAHRPTDRVPRLLYEEAIGYTPRIEQLLREHCAPKMPRDFFRMDITGMKVRPTSLPRTRFSAWLTSEADAIQADEWGVLWRGSGFHHFAHIESPLRDVQEFARLKEYPWPDLDQPYRFDGVSEQVAQLHRKGFAVAAFAGSVFEQSWYVRGMEQLMMDGR